MPACGFDEANQDAVAVKGGLASLPAPHRHRLVVCGGVRLCCGSTWGNNRKGNPFKARRAEGPSGSVAQWRGPRMRQASVARAIPRARPNPGLATIRPNRPAEADRRVVASCTAG